MIVKDDSSILNKFEASLTDNARVIIYDHNMFIVQATGHRSLIFSRLKPLMPWFVSFILTSNCFALQKWLFELKAYFLKTFCLFKCYKKCYIIFPLLCHFYHFDSVILFFCEMKCLLFTFSLFNIFLIQYSMIRFQFPHFSLFSLRLFFYWRCQQKILSIWKWKVI